MSLPEPFNSSTSMPSSGRLAGIDFGTVRIGVSICDPSQTWVSPLETYARRNQKLDRAYFQELAQREQLKGWIIGLPIHCDGQESQKSAEARAFAVWLSELTRIPSTLFDERFTTAEARRLLQTSELSSHQKKKRLDGLAAHLILTHFLESRKHGLSPNAALDDQPPVSLEPGSERRAFE